MFKIEATLTTENTRRTVEFLSAYDATSVLMNEARGYAEPDEAVESVTRITVPRPDRYGRTWDELPDSELCSECGQPDNCGDCTHGRLTDDDVLTLKGV